MSSQMDPIIIQVVQNLYSVQKCLLFKTNNKKQMMKNLVSLKEKDLACQSMLLNKSGMI